MNSRFARGIITRKQSGFIPVIPDIKCRSPKEGDLLRGRDPVKAAKLLAGCGAPALSVVTEGKNFGGSLQLLEKVAAGTTLPILRKDFITGAEDVKITRDCGAAAILLICSLHTFSSLMRLYEEVVNMGLEPLVEAHSEEEMRWVVQIGAKLVGINNRNIMELEKDDGSVSTTRRLVVLKPEGATLISESSIKNPAEAQAAIAAGADAVLIGTALWQAGNMEECFLALSRKPTGASL